MKPFRSRSEIKVKTAQPLSRSLRTCPFHGPLHWAAGRKPGLPWSRRSCRRRSPPSRRAPSTRSWRRTAWSDRCASAPATHTWRRRRGQVGSARLTAICKGMWPLVLEKRGSIGEILASGAEEANAIWEFDISLSNMAVAKVSGPRHTDTSSKW